ncbi:hypothetical protein [Novipirellula caenicola]|uniref:PSP1 C-terminal domain-containing protein n=1 Tax=Novipirellula caenicola TaxID=1536901 RepID=A0ABP9VK02_9BACT
MSHYYVRIGVFGDIFVGQPTASSVTSEFSYGMRVIVRTARGVELGTILGEAQQAASLSVDAAAKMPMIRLIRQTTREDELLIRRLERHKREAVEACRAALAESGSTAVLLDVDQVFDGGSLVMHFLGDVDETAEAITKEITERYESIVRTRHFAKLLGEGCGPGCGTAESENGCGSGCAGCAVKAACAVK